MDQKLLSGIKLGNGEQICSEMFADDSNALVANDDLSLRSFWQCLETYCPASGSKINHNKTGIRAMIEDPTDWLLNAGCTIMEEGKIFRLLGIPMGFKVTNCQKWKWALEQVESKLNRWKTKPLNIAGRCLVLNHYIIPSIIYFLSCWVPKKVEMQQFIKLCKNFL